MATKLPERNLDLLRATAVMLVVLSHALPIAADPFIDRWPIGRLGVLLFFVHTALVLMASLERGGTEPGWVGRFYVRRAFRIYPLSIVAVSIVAAFGIPAIADAHGIARQPIPLTLPLIVSNLLLVQNLIGLRSIIGVLWSLPLEIQMYVLLPICFLLAQRSAVWMALLIGAAVAAAGIVSLPLPGVWRLSVFMFGPCFMSGVLAYHLLRRTRPALPGWAWLPVLAALIVAFLASRPTPGQYWIGWLACVAVGAVIPAVGELGKSRLTDAAHWVATYSYGIYLIHVPLLWLWMVRLESLPVLARWAGWLLSTAGLSVALFRLVERPMIRLGTRLTAPRLALAPIVPKPVKPAAVV